jgi:Ca2+-dependent lipid-binding protein
VFQLLSLLLQVLLLKAQIVYVFLFSSRIENSLNPDWTIPFIFEHNATVFLQLQVSIYDNNEDRKADDKLMGEVVFDVEEVFSSQGQMLSESIAGNGGTVFCHVGESIKGDATGYCDLHFRGLDIKNVEKGLNRSDPFFELSKKYVDHESGIVRWNVVFRSKPIQDNLNPFWEPFSIPLEILCYGDMDWPLKISVLDHEKCGKHELIGFVETTMNVLMSRVAVKGNADRDTSFEIRKDGKEHSRGLIVVLKATVNAS